PANADPYWVNDARLLFTGIASYVMESPAIADENRSFATILKIMNGAEEPILEFLGSLRDTRRHEVSDFTLQTLLPYADMAEKQFSGLYAGVRTGMAPFLNERLMRATARSSFDIRNLKSERVSLYLDFRREQMASLGPLFNVLITQMMNFMSESMPRPGEHQVLVLLDEFQNLGKLEKVTDMATVLGGHGVPMWFFVQSLKSVDEIYRKESRETLINAARVQIFFGAQETDDLRYVSEQIGETAEFQKDVTRTQASLFDTYYTRSVHNKQIRRPLMRPDEIRTMDRSKVVILPRGENAILATRNFYFADRELSKRAFIALPESANAKHAKPVAATPPLPFQAVQSIVPVGPGYRSGLTQSRLPRGATFAAKVGRAERPPARRRLPGPQNSAGVEAPPVPPAAAARTASTSVDFSGLAARAAATRISPQKEAVIAAILAQAKSFRPQSADAETFDRNLSVVAEALPDVVDD
ncbi:type IV secretory system conjugative DNA transfer family protein, partial [Mesorhizobium sp.]